MISVYGQPGSPLRGVFPSEELLRQDLLLEVGEGRELPRGEQNQSICCLKFHIDPRIL